MNEAPSTRAYWTCQFVGWAYFSGLGVYQLVATHAPIGRLLLSPCVELLLGVGLSHLLFRATQRRRWFSLSARALVVRGIGAACAMAFVATFGTWFIERIHYEDRHQRLDSFLVSVTFGWFVEFFCWVATYFAIGLFRQRHEAAVRTLQLEKALQAAELRVLKSQLNPHFLFNSMNSIRALIADDAERARAAVSELSRILRYTFGVHEEELVPFAYEFEIVEDYLAIESLRLGERLVIERNVSRNAKEARIPPMLLQTIVENAIKHGIARLPAGGTLSVFADVVDGALLVRVENARPTSPVRMRRDDEDTGPIGLANAAERLRLLFGAAASLDLELSDVDRAVTRLRIPQGA